MSDKAKKIGLISAGCALILLISIFMLMSQRPAAAQGDWISQGGTKSISAVRIIDNESQLTLTLQKDGNVWRLSEDNGSEVEGIKMASLLAVLGYMKAEDAVENGAQEMQEYGTDDPRMVVDVTYEDGKSDSYFIGTDVPERGVYFQVSSDEKTVYLMDRYRAEVLRDFSEEMLSVSLKQVDFDKINGFYLYTPAHGDISVNKSESPRSEGGFYWNMTKPYTHYAKTREIEKIINAIAQIGSVNILPEAQPTGDYGFSEKGGMSLTLYDEMDREMRMDFGAVEGDRVYVKINGSETVCLMDKSVLQILDIVPEELVDSTFYYYEPASVVECKVRWKGEEISLGSLWIKDGDRQAQRYYLDGNVISGGAYNERAAAFAGLQIEPGVVGADELGHIIGTIELSRMSVPYEQTISLLELPGQAQRVAVDYGKGVIGTLDVGQFEQLVSRLKP